MAGLRIVLLCICAAVVYGILHDQVTARVCVEYFTIGHPRIVPTESPTVLGLVWGVIATWWVGLLLGLLMAFAARRGSRPKRTARSLLRPVARLLLVMAGFATAAGIAGWFAADAGWVFLLEPLASRVPVPRHVPFIAVLWAHIASYGVGAIGGFWTCSRVWKSRRTP
jgi:hypothetical protein